MKIWLKAGQPDVPLNLSTLGLTSLPENLPPLIQHLDVSGNQLYRLNLPPSLQSLNASSNQLTRLPEPLRTAILKEKVRHVENGLLPEKINLKNNPIPEQEIRLLDKRINALRYPNESGRSPKRIFERTFTQNQRAFSSFVLQHGLLADMQEDAFPTRLLAWSHQELELTPGATHFGFVFSGEAVLNCSAGSFTLKPGMYFSVPGSAIVSGKSEGIIVSRLGYDGFFQLGGPVEETGRLNYIDGCTDSLLIPPIMMGDPCLNLLCLPPNVEQTSHTHPSMCMCIVMSGEGICRTKDGNMSLRPGQVFIIPAHQEHAFATQGQSMRVIAYHPDSDFGATYQNHPMINRTIVDGVSAAELPHLQTR